MSIKEQHIRKKWIAVILFLLVDIAQIFFVSILTLDESSPYVIGIDLLQTNALVSVGVFFSILIFQIFLIFFTITTMLNQKGMQQIYPEMRKDEAWRCQYSREQIVEWTLELAKKSNARVDRVYVMKTPLPNAFTFSLPPFGSIVVLFTNLLDLLSPEEVKSIITHEIGHIKNHDSFTSMINRLPSFFIDAIYLYIYVRVGVAALSAILVSFDIFWFLIRLGVLAAFFALSRIFTFVSALFAQKASREAEILADYHAANVVGTEPTINALLRLGQRIEAVTALIDEIRWLESLNPERMNPINNAELNYMILNYPLDSIDDDNAREMAPWVFLYTRLKHMRDVYGIELSDKEIISIIEPAVDKLAEKRNEKNDESEVKRTLDWRLVDIDEDRRLSSEEINELVTLLRKNPKKLMFDSEIGKNILMLDHPDFRRRVLFLADAFGL